MKKSSYDNFFANFSSHLRLKILVNLADGPLSVGELVEKIGEEQSKVSHHLRQMAHCNLVNVKKDGKKRIYSLNERTVKPMLKLAQKHLYSSCGMCEGDCSACSGSRR